MDRARAGRRLAGRPGDTAAHQSSAPSVRIGTRPPGVRSYLVIADSGGEYAWTLTATELAEEFRTSCT